MDNAQERLAELILTCRAEDGQKFNYNKTSLLHGVMMECISSDYADVLHQQGLKPYSQYVARGNEDGVWQWHIRTLSEEAYCKIISPLLADELQDFYVEHNQVKVAIENRELNTFPVKKLFEDFYHKQSENVFWINFITPTSFKVNGRYRFYPDMFHIYRSLMNRMDVVLYDKDMFTEETLEQLTECTDVIAYNLRSTFFGLEGTRIPAFIGKIRIKIHGPQTMVNFARLLFSFGNFSGVGIKTAIGMGCISVSENERRSIDLPRY